MRIKEIIPQDRPRERMERAGPQVLSNGELLAVLLKSGTKKENVLQISYGLLAKYGLRNLSNASLQELCQEHGIGKAKACQIVALFELAKRIPLKEDQKVPILKSRDLAKNYVKKMQDLQKEHFIAVYLDSKNKIIGDQTITIGTLNTSLVHPREVFHGAVKHLANSIIILHNHPSGDPTPSEEDLEVTRVLDETGDVMGIPLLDHLVIGKQKWWSWKEQKISEL
jgi:DNA repair protein RadC